MSRSVATNLIGPRLGPALALAASLLAYSSLAAAAGPQLRPGAPVIFRDHWGVPHIYAAREADGFYALGYAEASDHLERLLFGIVQARGELAKTFTPADVPKPMRPLVATVDRLVEVDYLTKLWRIPRAAKQAVRHLDAPLRADYEAFVRGVGDYLVSHPERVPRWKPERISVADIVATAHTDVWMSYWPGMGTQDCQRGGVKPYVPGGRGPAGASNAWALMPARTSTGAAMLLSDPHGWNDGRFVYEYRLHTPSLSSAGFAQGPAMVIARNATLGWGLTTGAPDVSDCYRIERATPNGQSFLYDGRPRPILRQRLVIEVKGRSPVTVNAEYTDLNGVYSPVVAADEHTAWAVSTPYVEHLEGVHNAIYRLNRAATVDDVVSALSVPGTLIQNVIAADVHGQILYHRAGTAPRRPASSADWTKPVSGNSSNYAWAGVHPATDLVTIRSPASGYLQNNNVDPRFMFEQPPPETLGKPEYLLTDGWSNSDHPNERTELFRQQLERADRVTPDVARAIAMDVGMLGADRWTHLVALAASRAPLPGGDERRYLDELTAFDGRMAADSTAALKFVYWREALRALLVPEDGPALKATILGTAEPPEGLVQRAREAVSVAARRLAAAPGGLGRTYGDEFRLEAGATTVPMSGGALRTALGPAGPPAVDCSADDRLCAVTLFAVGYLPPDEHGLRLARYGTRMMRFDVFAPARIDSFTFQNPGASDDPASPNSTDQAQQLVSRRALKPLRFEWADLQPEIVSTQILNMANGRVTDSPPPR